MPDRAQLVMTPSESLSSPIKMSRVFSRLAFSSLLPHPPQGQFHRVGLEEADPTGMEAAGTGQRNEAVRWGPTQRKGTLSLQVQACLGGVLSLRDGEGRLRELGYLGKRTSGRGRNFRLPCADPALSPHGGQ